MERGLVELDPELSCLVQEVEGVGPCIRHPLVYAVPYFEGFNHYYNESLNVKKQQLERAVQALDFKCAITLHERPYRAQAFHNLSVQMPDDQYWELLSWIWRDTENFYQNRRLWLKLFWSKRDYRERFMSNEERQFLQALPDQLVIYRGHNSKNQKGFSWTLSEEKAHWFANRFAMRGAGIVSKKKVNKADVFAVLLRRGEYEVVYVPKKRPRPPKNPITS